MYVYLFHITSKCMWKIQITKFLIYFIIMLYFIFYKIIFLKKFGGNLRPKHIVFFQDFKYLYFTLFLLSKIIEPGPHGSFPILLCQFISFIPVVCLIRHFRSGVESRKAIAHVNFELFHIQWFNS